MFLFTASETLFMISMAMCYFYSWQTYAFDPNSVQKFSSENSKKEIIIGLDF